MKLIATPSDMNNDYMRKREVYDKSVSGMPMSRVESWLLYETMMQDAYKEGGVIAQREVEAWLGRNDIFFLLARLLRRPDIDNDWLFARCREFEREPDGCLDLWSRGHYKDIADDTPVLTDNRGWTTHGELRAGDYVFAPSGKPVRVIATSQKYSDSLCYRITFSDKHEIVCGAGHLWNLRKKISKRVPGTDKRAPVFVNDVCSTQELANNPQARMDVGVCAPLQVTDVNVHFIEPYTLGAWLGDGTSACGGFTCADNEIVERIRADGYEVKAHDYASAPYAHTIYGIMPILRAYGLLDNKHIPKQFLFASVDARMDLLRGLMDTDGHCDDRGTATFVNTNKQLVDDVYELATSLGLRPRKRKHITQVNGLPYEFYHVSFQAHRDRNPFHLSRKACKAIEPSKYRDCRYIRKIEPVASVPTMCVQVEGGLYCIGTALIPTHNSTIITFAGTIQEVLKNPDITIGIFSHTKGIARAFLKQIKSEFTENELLKAVYSDVLYADPEKESEQWNEEGIKVRRKANPKEATIEAWGLVDGQPTSKHYALRVYDDVVTRESVSTADQIKKTTEAWELSLNLGTTEGRERYIGTRYALYDTYSTMIARDVVKVRKYPATNNGRIDGKPVFLSQAQWDRIVKTRSRSSIAAQQLQNPQADESAMFMPTWLRHYDVRPLTMNVYILCDPSRGRSAESDNTAIAVIGISTTGAKYLLDGMCHRMQLSKRWTNIRNFHKKWSRARGVQHVAVGYERYGAQSDDEYFQERMRIENYYFNMKELNWTRDGTQSKRERVERLEPDFRNSRFFLPYPVTRDGLPFIWHVDNDKESNTFGTVVLTPLHTRGLTRNQERVINAGAPDLLAKALRCVDDDGHVYDLTRHFMDEFMQFPFGRYKDLIDATSRIYDMEPTAPRVFKPSALEPQQAWDR